VEKAIKTSKEERQEKAKRVI